jgi:hypothetical protein
MDSGANLTISAPVASTGNVIMNGAGALTITNTVALGGIDGSNNPLGIVQVHQGTVNVNAGGAITNSIEIDVGDSPGQTGTLNLASGTVIAPYSPFAVNPVTSYGTYPAVYVGVNGGIGNVTLSGNSLFDATSRMNNGPGTIFIGVDSGTGPGTGTVTVGDNSIMRAGNGDGTNGSVIDMAAGGTGTLIIQGNGLVQTDNFWMGDYGDSPVGAYYYSAGTANLLICTSTAARCRYPRSTTTAAPQPTFTSTAAGCRPLRAATSSRTTGARSTPTSKPAASSSTPTGTTFFSTPRSCRIPAARVAG